MKRPGKIVDLFLHLRRMGLVISTKRLMGAWEYARNIGTVQSFAHAKYIVQVRKTNLDLMTNIFSLFCSTLRAFGAPAEGVVLIWKTLYGHMGGVRNVWTCTKGPRDSRMYI